jgi:hypothetical protein
VPNLEEYRAGLTGEEDEQDAAVQEETEETEELELEEETEEQETEEEEQENEEPELPAKEQSAFVKRLEREREKLRASMEAELKEQYEQQLNPMRTFFDQLGLDPANAMQIVEDNKRRAEMQRIAEQNGWDEDETNFHFNQQKQLDEIQSLRVDVAINELASNPMYAGIKDMKPAILTKIKQSGGALTASEAYWAVGGQARAEQMKREAEARATIKQKEQKRTVQSDAPSAVSTEKALPSDILKVAREMGISEKEAKRLLSVPDNLEAYRKMKK